MIAYVFPGQGAQYIGMGKDLYDNFSKAKDLFNKANSILKFKITDIMFDRTEEELKQTNVTQPAIIGLDDAVVENICKEVDEIVVPANYNTPGQLVISGSVAGIDKAIALLNEAGAKRALKLKVGGAFHSPLMEPARIELAKAIAATKFNQGICPVYQNVTGQPVNDPEIIKSNLIQQLVSPVQWTQTMKNMIADGVNKVIEVGPGKVLQGMFKKIDRQLNTESAKI